MMAAHLRLVHLIDSLQDWSASLPLDSETFAHLPLKPQPPIFEDLELLRKASEDLSDTLQTLQELAKMIEKPSHELTASYRRARNHHLPPMRLPVELIGYVFEMACKPEPVSPQWQPSFDSVVQCRRMRHAIGSSCSHFRRVLLETRTAWNHIPVLIDGNLHPLHQTRDLLPLELARASRNTVHLYVSFKHANLTESSDFMASWKHLYSTLPAMQNHLKTLVIESDQTLPSTVILAGISDGRMFPALKSLYIDIHGHSSYARLDLRGFPSLESLFVRYMMWRAHPIDIIHGLSITCNSTSLIRELTLNGSIYADDALELLRSCHESIQVFRWTWPEGGTQSLPKPSRSVLKFPRLRSLELTVADPFAFLNPARFEMPNLQDLTVGYSGHDQQSADIHTIVLPSLHSCQIDYKSWRQNCLHSFFRKNPTIRCIKTMAPLAIVASFFATAAASASALDEILPHLDRLHNICMGRPWEGLQPWFDSIRARRRPFVICLEVVGQSFDKELLDQHADVVRFEAYAPL
ncbi:hypothetical protein DL93DRAFT_1652617 [Clavulina sp. PMI_390]|nr:hypothetical protein DL93DRAFT_1652617 [Clavulina sp. PMI_390]